MGGIPAVGGKGENLLLFIGIIDILQSYRSETLESLSPQGLGVMTCESMRRCQSVCVLLVLRCCPPTLMVLSGPLRALDVLRLCC